MFRFHTTELKQVFMNLRYSLVFAVQENFSIQYPLWNFSDSFCSFSSFVFIMENYAYHSSLSSHVPHLPYCAWQEVVTSCWSQHWLRYNIFLLRKQTLKTVQCGWIKFIVNLFCVFLTRTLNSSQSTSILVEFCSKLARVYMSHFQVCFFMYLPLRRNLFRWLRQLYKSIIKDFNPVIRACTEMVSVEHIVGEVGRIFF